MLRHVHQRLCAAILAAAGTPSSLRWWPGLTHLLAVRAFADAVGAVVAPAPAHAAVRAALWTPAERIGPSLSWTAACGTSLGGPLCCCMSSFCMDTLHEQSACRHILPCAPVQWQPDGRAVPRLLHLLAEHRQRHLNLQAPRNAASHAELTLMPHLSHAKGLQRCLVAAACNRQQNLMPCRRQSRGSTWRPCHLPPASPRAAAQAARRHTRNIPRPPSAATKSY